ncbi:hypothetical protein B0J13DRAFT_206858 [Dactylonectria estremocensis]|uniref:Uncharacterized protein n=1 Tax=Dactylonectria estremocensis TaxID=1079267 RepID=A0A9P9IBV2_9HYPO|nr:hypothetical protein B0J13DRAFT_206858 [Dactylonectria estremocensis]
MSSRKAAGCGAMSIKFTNQAFKAGFFPLLFSAGASETNMLDLIASGCPPVYPSSSLPSSAPSSPPCPSSSSSFSSYPGLYPHRRLRSRLHHRATASASPADDVNAAEPWSCRVVPLNAVATQSYRNPLCRNHKVTHPFGCGTRQELVACHLPTLSVRYVESSCFMCAPCSVRRCFVGMLNACIYYRKEMLLQHSDTLPPIN